MARDCSSSSLDSQWFCFYISSNQEYDEGMNKTHSANSIIASKQKRAWSSPVLINLSLADTAVGKSDSGFKEGCKSDTNCKSAWRNTFGPS